MQQKRFAKNDEGFICAHCGKEVVPLGYSSRNHCPFCLWSLHLDINPGDRASECGGSLEPIRVEPDPRKGSKTRSPGSELARISLARSFSGFWVG